MGPSKEGNVPFPHGDRHSLCRDSSGRGPARYQLRSTQEPREARSGANRVTEISGQLLRRDANHRSDLPPEAVCSQAKRGSGNREGRDRLPCRAEDRYGHAVEPLLALLEVQRETLRGNRSDVLEELQRIHDCRGCSAGQVSPCHDSLVVAATALLTRQSEQYLAQCRAVHRESLTNPGRGDVESFLIVHLSFSLLDGKKI